MSRLKLGVLYKNGEIVNHRSLFKVVLNPIFRCFGFCLGTHFENGRLGGYSLMRCPKRRLVWNSDDHNEFDKIEKVRWLV